MKACYYKDKLEFKKPSEMINICGIIVIIEIKKISEIIK